MVRNAALCALLGGCLRFSAHPIANHKPVAVVAKDSFVVAPHQAVALDGSASTDEDGDPLTYRWEVAASTDVLIIADPTSPSVAITMPDRGQRVFIRLLVNDGAEDSDPALVQMRVNTSPRANPGGFRSGAPPLLLQGAAEDPEGDAITEWAWNVQSGPACINDASCFEDATAQVAHFQPPVPGDYVLTLRASDGIAFGEAAPVAVTVFAANRPPTLALSQSQEVATEGVAFAELNAVATLDPDGDPVTVTWTKTAGATGFPNVLQGTRPVIVAPPFVPADDNSASYSVVASDGVLQSAAQQVTLYAAPGAGFVVVSSGANAADTALCGTRALPCRSLRYGLGLVSGERHIVMTTGSYVDTPVDTAQGLQWKPATSLYAGRDPVTFARSTASSLLFNSGCAVGNTSPGFFLGATVTGIEFDNLSVSLFVNCANTHTTFICAGCAMKLKNVTATSASIDGASTALHVNNGNVSIENSSLIAANGHITRGIYAEAGSIVAVADSVVSANSPGPDVSAADSSALRENNSQVTAKRTGFRLLGSYSNTANSQPSAGLYLNGGSFVGENIDIAQRVNTVFSGVYVDNPAALTLINATMDGPSAGTGGAAAISSPGAVSIMNTLVHGFPRGFDMRAPAAQGSALFANVLDAVPVAATCPSGSVSDLNAGVPCNSSGNVWAGNAVGSCPFVASASFDFRLADVPNACVNAGTSSSVVGTAPVLDKKKTARGPAPDVGSDELR